MKNVRDKKGSLSNGGTSNTLSNNHWIMEWKMIKCSFVSLYSYAETPNRANEFVDLFFFSNSGGIT